MVSCRWSWRRVRPSLSFALVAGAMAAQLFVTAVPVWGQVAMPVVTLAVAWLGYRVLQRRGSPAGEAAYVR